MYAPERQYSRQAFAEIVKKSKNVEADSSIMRSGAQNQSESNPLYKKMNCKPSKAGIGPKINLYRIVNILWPFLRLEAVEGGGSTGRLVRHHATDGAPEDLGWCPVVEWALLWGEIN